MTLNSINVEIVKRADETFNVNEYLERAEAHFRSAISHLLVSNVDFTEQDYPAMVKREELRLGVNCAYPDGNIDNIKLQFRLLRPIGAYYFSQSNVGYKSVRMIIDDKEFNHTINNPLSRISEIVNISFIEEKVIVYPFFEKCFLKYIRKFNKNDVVFTRDLEESFSLKFLHTAIDLAVVGLKNEVTAQELQ